MHASTTAKLHMYSAIAYAGNKTVGSCIYQDIIFLS